MEQKWERVRQSNSNKDHLKSWYTFDLFLIRWDYKATEAGMIQVLEYLGGSLSIKDNFDPTVTAHDPSKPQAQTSPSCRANPQTTQMCAMLDIADIFGKK